MIAVGYAVWRSYRWFGYSAVLADSRDFPPAWVRDWQYFSSTLHQRWPNVDAALSWLWQQMTIANTYRRSSPIPMSQLGAHYRTAANDLFNGEVRACQWTTPLGQYFLALAVVGTYECSQLREES